VIKTEAVGVVGNGQNAAYIKPAEMNIFTFLTLCDLLDVRGIKLSEISEATGLDPDDIARYHPGYEYIDDRKPAEARYRDYRSMPRRILRALRNLEKASEQMPPDGKLTVAEAGTMTYTDRKVIAEHFPYFMNDESNAAWIEDVTRAIHDGVKEKLGREPRVPKTGAQKFREGWLEGRVEKPQVDYDCFANALRDYNAGESVENRIDLYNPYFKALYKVAVDQRTVNSLTRNGDVDAIRLSKFLLPEYALFEKVEDRSRNTYRITQKGKDFLCALHPKFGKVLESGLEPYLGESRYV